MVWGWGNGGGRGGWFWMVVGFGGDDNGRYIVEWVGV